MRTSENPFHLLILLGSSAYRRDLSLRAEPSFLEILGGPRSSHSSFTNALGEPDALEARCLDILGEPSVLEPSFLEVLGEPSGPNV